MCAIGGDVVCIQKVASKILLLRYGGSCCSRVDIVRHRQIFCSNGFVSRSEIIDKKGINVNKRQA